MTTSHINYCTRDAASQSGAHSVVENEVQVDVGARVKNLLRAAERKDGVLDPLTVVDNYLPDPLDIQDFEISQRGALTNFQMNLMRMKLYGLKSLDIDSMRFNLGWMHVDVIMSIPFLQLLGKYDLDGKLMFVPLKGSGDFEMNVTDLVITTRASLDQEVGKKLQVANMTLELETHAIKMHFDNLMGGSGWSAASNALINTINHLIFDHVKHSLLEELEQDVQKHLNEQLDKLPQNFIHDRSESLFDALLAKLRNEVKTSGYDPLSLPDQRQGFSRNVFGVFNVTGEATIYNGTLFGLSTLVRTGDVIATYQNDSVTLEANLGFRNLTGHYDWSATLLSAGPGGLATLHVDGIQARITIKQGLKRGDEPVLDSFDVSGMNGMWVDITGLGTWDFVIEGLVNLLTNTFKGTVARAISGPMKEALQKQLRSLPVSLFV